MCKQVAKKDIGRCFKEIVEVLKASGGQHAMTLAPTASHPADHMKRFAADLSLPFPVLKICQDMARNARPEGTNANFVWDARSPLSIAAAVIFIVTQLKCAPSETISMQDLCMVTNVSEGTIRGVYKDMYPSIRNLLPPGAATEQQLARLPVPEMLAPRKPPQAPCSSQEATQPAASEPGHSTPPPAKRNKCTKAEQAAEPTNGTGKGKGKVAKAKPAPQLGRWLDRDCNAALNMQRIGESRWRPLELCWWPEQAALPAKGKEYPGLGYKRLRDKPPKAQQEQPDVAQ
ncbi:hypothetical protein QJQ45_029736 [Haematococcus lacustris]|nr:hypothetical protein QJQ45_029736 [Haematococcus lacustris]